MDAPMYPHLTSKADLERACAALTAMHAPVLPIFRAAADGLIGLVFLHDPETAWPTELIAAIRRPILVVVSDDCEPERRSSPPSAWRCADQLRDWASAVIVHGAGAQPEHYRLAVATTLLFGRAVLIETNSRLAIEWGRFMKRLAPLVIVPREGRPHPVAPSPGALQ